MTGLKRFGVSLDSELLKKFDSYIKEKRYINRSEAIRDLIREAFVKVEWQKGKEVAGAVVLVYDHHRRELVDKVIDIQHDFGEIIISTQHVHLDHDNCLEVVVVKGKPVKVRELFETLRAIKGVKHGVLNMTTTGKEVM